MDHVILIKKERGFFMDFFNIPQAENALKAVYKFGIDTNEKLMALTLDNLMNIKGLGKKKMEAILKSNNVKLNLIYLMILKMIKEKVIILLM